MTSVRLANYIRTHRKRLGLTQKDVAFLLNVYDGAKVCRYEQFKSEPSLRTALALEIIFRMSVSELFAGLHDSAQHDVLVRTRQLQRQLSQCDEDSRKERREAALERIIESPDSSE